MSDNCSLVKVKLRPVLMSKILILSDKTINRRFGEK